MKDKEKQINEMAKIIDDNHGFIVSSVETAQAIYNAGYRKLPEVSVVLTREEYEDLQVGKDFDYGYHEGCKNTEAYYENFKLPEIRKETAEKYHTLMNDCIKSNLNIRKNKNTFAMALSRDNDELAKQLSVEIKEN